MEAEAACDKALSQHKSGKGYFRRARARKMQGHVDGAIKGAEVYNTLCWKRMHSQLPLSLVLTTALGRP